MTTIPIQDAQANLLEIIHKLTPGEEVVITEAHPVIRGAVLGTLRSGGHEERIQGIRRLGRRGEAGRNHPK